ncbi:macro domain-containing protein [Bifidobacterium choloepi]|uniref:Thoeris protein ThsA Macro domain-containing protein n=1 Tax=Bifidobacterium choloepi TaxID=2614131 RepID=A0A6I5N951_9BIFI|nr:macro domain-containing protein [Bifidobacterium choloepi]NEG70341.1 hypothetical protein [Bifidobacterium choloepi]
MTGKVQRFISYRKHWNYWKKFIAALFSVFGSLCLVLDFASFVWDSLPLRGWKLTLVFIVIALGAAAFLTRERPPKKEYSFGSTVEIVSGDLFDQDCSIVVGTCTTFDTDVESRIIASSSIQGQVLSKVYSNDLQSLDEDIEIALSNEDPVGEIAKEGKTKRYPIGTVAVLRPKRLDSRIYFVAYTEMSETNTAASRIDYLWNSLSSLWEKVQQNENGEPIAIPAIGQGMSRLKPFLTLEDSIRLIITSFVFSSRSTIISNNLRIVLPENSYESIDRVAMQNFMNQLA